MAARDEKDPYGIIPEPFLEKYDTNDPAEALRRAERAPSTTPADEFDRCPFCESPQIERKAGKLDMPHKRPENYRCNGSCGQHFDEPAPPHAERPVEAAWIWLLEHQRRREPDKTMPIHTPFNWLTRTDLKDPDERGLTHPLDGLDEDTRTALAIRLYRPWDADGARAYRKVAYLLGTSRWFVGSRVRAWRDGEYRDLVPDPTPSVDASATEAVAADGGTPSES